MQHAVLKIPHTHAALDRRLPPHAVWLVVLKVTLVHERAVHVELALAVEVAVAKRAVVHNVLLRVHQPADAVDLPVQHRALADLAVWVGKLAIHEVVVAVGAMELDVFLLVLWRWLDRYQMQYQRQHSKKTNRRQQTWKPCDR